VKEELEDNRRHRRLSSGEEENLRLDVEGQRKVPEALVFSDAVGEPIGDFRGAWKRTLRQANIADLRWHDLRHECASRLVERGTPLSQVRDLLGHASIMTTERYDNQRPEALLEARDWKLARLSQFLHSRHSVTLSPSNPKTMTLTCWKITNYQ
jgi:integrase